MQSQAYFSRIRGPFVTSPAFVFCPTIKYDVTSNGKRQKWNFCRLSLALCTVEWKYLYLRWIVEDIFLFLWSLFKDYKKRKIVRGNLWRLPSPVNVLLKLSINSSNTRQHFVIESRVNRYCNRFRNFSGINLKPFVERHLYWNFTRTHKIRREFILLERERIFSLSWKACDRKKYFCPSRIVRRRPSTALEGPSTSQWIKRAFESTYGNTRVTKLNHIMKRPKRRKRRKRNPLKQRPANARTVDTLIRIAELISSNRLSLLSQTIWTQLNDLCSPWVLVAQWIERPSGVRPAGHGFDSCRRLRFFFFFPRSCHADQFTFHNSLSEHKIHHLYSLITVINLTRKPFRQLETLQAADLKTFSLFSVLNLFVYRL